MRGRLEKENQWKKGRSNSRMEELGPDTVGTERGELERKPVGETEAWRWGGRGGRGPAASGRRPQGAWLFVGVPGRVCNLQGWRVPDHGPS